MTQPRTGTLSAIRYSLDCAEDRHIFSFARLNAERDARVEAWLESLPAERAEDIRFWRFWVNAFYQAAKKPTYECGTCPTCGCGDVEIDCEPGDATWDTWRKLSNWVRWSGFAVPDSVTREPAMPYKFVTLFDRYGI
jgi:hypothetical protein